MDDFSLSFTDIGNPAYITEYDKLVTNDMNSIILNNTEIIDVRSEGEYMNSMLPNSVNIPVLNNEHRKMVGITYKSLGKIDAVTLGDGLVSKEYREQIIQKWIYEFQNNPNSVIMCSRGGLRSKISQAWLNNTLKSFDSTDHKQIIRISGGYKEMRNHLIKAITPENIKTPFVMLCGLTGVGKTIAIQNIDNSIDLELLANHRGSAFGHKPDPQPAQATFENALAYDIIKKTANNPPFFTLEKESTNIGVITIPKNFHNYMLNSPYVVISASLEERVDITFNEYVLDELIKYEEFYNNLSDDDKVSLGEKTSRDLWADYIRDSLIHVKKKLGDVRLKEVLQIFENAYKSDNIENHKEWIYYVLKNYYDPIYAKLQESWKDHIVYSGSINEVVDYLNYHTKISKLPSK